MSCFALYIFGSGKESKKYRNHHKKESKNSAPINRDEFNQQFVFEKPVQMFESKCLSISHFFCQKCQMTGIKIKPSQKIEIFVLNVKYLKLRIMK